MNPNKKYLDIALVVLALIVWALFHQLLSFGWGLLRLPVYEFLPVSVPAIIAAVLAIITFVILKRNETVNEFGLEVVVELSKVTWPTRKETMLSTGVIIVMVAIASVLMFGIDALWGTLTSRFLEF